MAELSTVYTTRFDSPIGSLGVASTELGLAYVALPHASGRGLEGHLAKHFLSAQVAEDIAANQSAVEQIHSYLEGTTRAFELALDLRGTPFQCEVWQALREIPFGDTRSYAQVARAVRRPTGSVPRPSVRVSDRRGRRRRSPPPAPRSWRLAHRAIRRGGR